MTPSIGTVPHVPETRQSHGPPIASANVVGLLHPMFHPPLVEAIRQHGAPVRRAFYQEAYPASTLVEIPGLARPEFLVEIEVIAAVA